MHTRLVSAVIALFIAAPDSFAQKPESSGPDPDVILKNLYKAHDAQKGPFFDRENRKLAEQYFTKELAGLIVKDAVESQGEVGAYGMDPLYDSQDPQVKNFKIGAVQWGGIKKREDDEGDEGFALVNVTFTDNGKKREIRYGFEQQADKTWRISEIHYSEGSLLEMLRTTYPDGAQSKAEATPAASNSTARAALQAAVQASSKGESTAASKASSPGVSKASPKSTAQYEIVKGTASPDGRYALAWGVKGVADLKKLLKSGAEVDTDKLENYILDTTTGTPVTTLAEASFYTTANGDAVSDADLAAAWSPASDTVVVNYYAGKWGNVFLRAYGIADGAVKGNTEIQPELEKQANAFLAKKYGAKHRKVKDDLIFYHSNLAAEKGGGYSIVASTGLLKNADHEDELGAHMRVRFQAAAEGDAVKSKIVAVEPPTAPGSN